ncbi:MAG: heavy-metal-associated domain-containing protein [Myxococcota bacterium]
MISTPERSVQDHTDSVVHLSIEGMTCGGCVVSVERALAAVQGVRSVHVDLGAKRATVRLEVGRGDVARLLGAVDAAGFDAVVLS